MWIRLRDLVKVKIVASLIPVAFYRIHPQSMMAKRLRNKEYDLKVQKMLKDAIEMRKRDGINKGNTRFQ
jgi:pyruvate-formate lyase-activating enzyme